MLELLTTDVFAEWFAALDDELAEEVATALDLVEALGVERTPPASRELLLWYEHPCVAEFALAHSLAWELEDWGAFRGYAERALAKLETPGFVARVGRLGASESARVLRAVQRIRRLADPRARWALHASAALGAAQGTRAERASTELRRLYFEALEAAGFTPGEPPVPARALYELSRRAPGRPFRLLYGVDAEHGRGLVLLGERLDRSYYGDSVRRAERLWRGFLEGALSNLERLELR
jgi:hypothetical protein